MNGVHDMGGMHGMGPIRVEKNEPVFHAEWEKRVFALNRAMGAWRKWNIDASRHQRELIPAADYLRMSYYERFFEALIELSSQRGLLTRKEIDGAQPVVSSETVPALTAGMVPQLVMKGAPTNRDVPVKAAFKAGEGVRAKNIHPVGHTRLPRYARGRQGIVVRDHGVFVFPDTNAHFSGETPQHVYSVRFEARELWGDSAVLHDAVYIDLWEDYLERS